jgi:hypothetical protein
MGAGHHQEKPARLKIIKGTYLYMKAITKTKHFFCMFFTNYIHEPSIDVFITRKKIDVIIKLFVRSICVN